jgi:carboxylesterase type B
MLGVLFFKSAAYKTAQYHSKITSDTYYYSFEYEGRYTRHPTEDAGFPSGVAHADDLQYVFQLTGELNEEEQALSDIMVDYWVNFIYTGYYTACNLCIIFNIIIFSILEIRIFIHLLKVITTTCFQTGLN